jgi:hypothetical protein
LIREVHESRRLVANALVIGALVTCITLFAHPPDPAGFWPVCPIHQLLGIECPGCGATRALAALLHGRVLQALQLNALFVLLLPFGMAVAIQTYRRAIRPGSFRWPDPPISAIYSAVAASVAFTIARNVAH